jgi:6-pyruvoyltetrahydropterin/6-carboxytetrahydropterin synthase
VNGLAVTVRHSFETAHRLPALGGKCVSLHGHSWQVEWTVAGYPDDTGVLVEYGHLKRVLRGWVDTRLDHGTMLGVADPLAPLLEGQGCKVFRFGVGGEDPARTRDAEDLISDHPWPTVESVAVLLARAGSLCLAEATGGYLDGSDLRRLRVSRVCVQETAVNAAEWTDGEGPW